jgi:thioredoxin-like negative regulator of GroEL
MKRALYFTAAWCGPCRMIKPKIEALKSQGLSIQIIDVDQAPSQAQTLGIRNVPTIILMEDGAEKQRMVGNNINTETIKQFLN